MHNKTLMKIITTNNGYHQSLAIEHLGL